MAIKKPVTIMDVDFFSDTKTVFLEDHLFPKLKKEEKCFVVTANPEIVMKTREDESYKRIVQSADYVVPDGAGILLAARYLKQPLPERIAGFDLMVSLLEFAHAENLSVYLLGAQKKVNEKVVVEIKKRFPNIIIAGHQDGFFKLGNKSVVEKVRQASPDIVLVALGLPKQEQWINTYIDSFQKGLFIGVGGSFDVLAGEVKRAPQKWIDLNIEWLYRIVQQPFRAKRILKVFEFMFRIIFKRS